MKTGFLSNVFCQLQRLGIYLDLLSYIIDILSLCSVFVRVSNTSWVKATVLSSFTSQQRRRIIYEYTEDC